MQISSNTKADVAIIAREFQNNNNRVNDVIRNHFPVDKIEGQEYVSFICTVNSDFNKSELQERGIIVGSRINDIVSLKYPIQNINEILSETGISYLKMAGKARAMLDKVKIGTHVDSVWAGIDLPQGYTGKDVIIGITDWGFDYSSPMFYDTLLQDTRIIAAWDQFKTSGSAPAAYGYGAEYTTPAEFVSAGADTANFYSYATHGTHVAGIAGGSGAGLEYRGMAFESEFLFVTFLFNEAAVLDAWEWMYDKSVIEGKRLVISMSWGIYHMGALDGSDVLAQAIDAYSALGVVFVSSAGNNGGVNFHIDKDYNNDTIKTKINFYANAGMPTLWGQSIHMWGEAGNEFSSQLVITDVSSNIIASSPWYSTSSTPSYIDSFVVAGGTDTVFFNLSADAAYPSNGRPQTRLRVSPPTSNYKVGIRSTAVSGRVHYWNLTELTTDVGNWGMAFSGLGSGSTSGDAQYGVGVPACANTAIAVGAYSSEFYTITNNLVGGAEASFSSYGPLMDGTLKPDVSAPGVNVASSISSYTDNSFGQIASVDFNGRTYPFARFSGTSMSGPACAGIAAILLEVNPFLSANQVKSIIIETARTDNHTGPIPPHSAKWGWGKVNAYAAAVLATSVVGENEVDQLNTWMVSPNPTTNEISLNGVEGTVDNIQIIDMTGKSLIELTELNVIDVSTLDAGAYFVRILVDGKVQQIKFIKE